ncbi:MAG: FMN-binding glutamate synthase family protein [Candidatus Hydrogenedentes bacterium]|nr:FMN-binding glutamate synthase family protein [Candidatus Hydrogenedentota bacterium]
MVRKFFFVSAAVLPILILVVATRWPQALLLFVVVGPYIALGLHDITQKKHALLRVYPVIGHGRYMMEFLRPEIQQYFVETNIDGTPFSREFRSVVYQRAKGDLDTRPFGTQHDVNRIGYEWMNHSMNPKPAMEEEPKIQFGGPDCEKPYLSSHLNISAMSFGSLSKNAILALNLGAKQGGFAHNTGEGGISPYHTRHGGDLIWQIGTGYFGCRTPDGAFDLELYSQNAQRDQVKMIEIKLSQGAKPAHGGILPGEKVNAEIAEIRNVPIGRDVISPPGHSAFTNPVGLLEFVAQLRRASGGKPVGFKLCIGYRSEFLGICKAMLDTGILPDFITIDGAEGGTGAAPLELSNSVGTPMRDGLIFVHSALAGIGVRDQIRLVTAGKLSTAFHIFRALALGADTCNSARAMMFALGCIQARRCNDNSCPVGVATQDPTRTQGLVVQDKARRVAEYHRATIHSLMELVGAAGLDSPDEIDQHHILRRVDAFTIRHFGDLYPFLSEKRLLVTEELAEPWHSEWKIARADAWVH